MIAVVPMVAHSFEFAAAIRNGAPNSLAELTLRFAKASSTVAVAQAGTAFTISANLYPDIRRRYCLDRRALFDARRHLIRINGRSGDNG